jgi:hypothetical protein
MNPEEIDVGTPIAYLDMREIQAEERTMLGWMIVFALISVLGGLSTMTGATPAISMKMTSLLFASLFFLGLLTYAIRGRAR